MISTLLSTLLSGFQCAAGVTPPSGGDPTNACCASGQLVDSSAYFFGFMGVAASLVFACKFFILFLYCVNILLPQIKKRFNIKLT
jgi:hypothetical protein